MLNYPKEYLEDVMVRFAYNSNAIEGNMLTLGQTRAVILNETVVSTGIEGVKLKDLYAADNQKDTFNELIYLANNDAPLDMNTLMKLQFELTKNTIPSAGKFKTQENYIIWRLNPNSLAVGFPIYFVIFYYLFYLWLISFNICLFTGNLHLLNYSENWGAFMVPVALTLVSFGRSCYRQYEKAQ